MQRRTFFQSLLGWGTAASAGLPATPAVPRGIVAVTVHCPRCGRTPLPPSFRASGPLMPREMLDEVWVDCVPECGERYRTRFCVEV